MSNVVYNQHSDPWGPQQLGSTPGATIAQFGCLDACFAMAVTDAASPLDPGEMCNIFRRTNTFVQGDLLPSNALTLVDPTHWKTEVYPYHGIPADLTKLRIQPGQILILEVDFDHNPNDGIQTHFVESLGWPQIKDPWFGDWVPFSPRYGDPATTIQQIIILTRLQPPEPIVVPPVIIDPCLDLKAQLAATKADLQKALTTIQGYTEWLSKAPK